MTILHILNELCPSGAEMMIKTAYPYWCGETEGTVMATAADEGPFADTLRDTGYDVVHVPTIGTGKKAKLRHLWSFFRYMRKHRYDVVHIHKESMAFEYALICKLTGNRRILRTVHSTFAHTGVQRVIKSITRRLMKRVLGVRFVAISDGVAANEKKVFGLTCNEVIYNWCSNDRFLYIPELEKTMPKREMLDKVSRKLSLMSSRILTITTVGTCADVKNHPLLLRAIALMKKKDRIHYYHIGYADGFTEEEKRLAGSLGIAGLVTFAGRTDPMPYLRAADVYLMTSKYEGLSIAALEAIFTGMPVLLSDVRGLDEFKNKDLDNVEYFEPTPEALAAKLDAYADRLMARKLVPSEAQSNRAKELYDIKQQTAKYLALYRG